jgi:hypothetical protein
LRFDHVERQHRRDRGVGGAAPGAKDLGPGCRSARVGGADHTLGEDRRTAGFARRDSRRQQQRGGEQDQEA